MNESGVAAAISSALATAPFMPFAGSVKTSSAPKARSSTRRSRDMLAGIVRTSLYPLAAAMKARPIPVLPLVGSIKVVLPGLIFPASSASVTMAYPILSFTEQHGSMFSSLAAILAPAPAQTLFRYTMGVLPISSVTSLAMFIFTPGTMTALQESRGVREACLLRKAVGRKEALLAARREACILLPYGLVIVCLISFAAKGVGLA
mmetsp:Transcript_2410/g.6214  ORF Transcript_2410/g.6214 Transcript_2410/m.6214 type:complete len:205 (-) Transcript_2410:1472-2086(-)